MTRPRKKSRRKRDSNPGSSVLEADTLTTRPTRRLSVRGKDDLWFQISDMQLEFKRFLLLLRSPVISLGFTILGETLAYVTHLVHAVRAWLLRLRPRRAVGHRGECERFVCLLVGCLTSKQHASVSQGRICSDSLLWRLPCQTLRAIRLVAGLVSLLVGLLVA